MQFRYVRTSSWCDTHTHTHTRTNCGGMAHKDSRLTIIWESVSFFEIVSTVSIVTDCRLLNISYFVR